MLRRDIPDGNTSLTVFPCQPNKRGKTVKEHRIQFMWVQHDESKQNFIPVRQKNGGGNRLISHTDADNWKTSALFFPDGKSSWAGHLNEMNK